jgi:2-dehydro-3-deoxygluconokinase
MRAAKESGTVVSYDLNYRESLWAGRGGRTAANRVNRELLEYADVVFGVEKFDASVSGYSDEVFAKAASAIASRHSNIQVMATTLRDVHSASRHSLGGACFAHGETFTSNNYDDVDVLDRVGSGDAFAAGFIYGMISGTTLQTAIDLAAASAVLSMASLGDGSSATLAEIKSLASGSVNKTVR